MAEAIKQTREALENALSNIENQMAAVRGMIEDIDERIRRNKAKGNVVDLGNLSPNEKEAFHQFIKEEIEEPYEGGQEAITVKKLMPKMRDKV